MAFQAGKSALFKIGNSAAVLTDISAYLDDINFPSLAETPETTTFGANSKTRIVTLKDANISIKGPWDPTFDAIMTGIYGLSARAFEFGPIGSTAGNPKRTGNAILQNYQVQTPVGGAITFTAQFQVTGDVTATTY